MGCQQNVRPEAAAVEPAVASPRFTTVTLSADQLMSLDWAGRGIGRVAILDQRPVGAGVEFDVRFPGSDVGICSLDYVSSGSAGQGILAHRDVSVYQAFALKFTLVAVNGLTDPNFPLKLAAGAIIGPAGDGKMSSCEPVTLGLDPEHATQVAKTPMRTGRVHVIGIHVHAVNPQSWDATGCIVTFRVEPAADAEILPSPAPAPERKSGSSAARSVRRKPQSEPAKSSKPASKPRTKSQSNPALGTTHIGAW